MAATHTTECLDRTRTSLHENLLHDWEGDTKLNSPFWAKLDEQVTDALTDAMFCAEHGCNDEPQADTVADQIHTLGHGITGRRVRIVGGATGEVQTTYTSAGRVDALEVAVDRNLAHSERFSQRMVLELGVEDVVEILA